MWIMPDCDQREENIGNNTVSTIDDGPKSQLPSKNPNHSRLSQCLSALDQDVQRLSKLSIDNKAKSNLQFLESINNSHVGFYYRIQENVFISYYSSPSQTSQLEKNTLKSKIDLNLHQVLESLSEQYSLTVRNSQSHNTLQIQPILNKNPPLSFANVDGIKGISLDAEFVIILKQYTPIQLSVIKDIEKITELPVIKYSVNNLKVPCKEDNLAEDFLNLVYFKYNQLGLENLDNYLVFKEIGMEHVYKRVSSSNVKGFLVKEIPFSSPAQLVEVVTLLRKQAKFTSLLSTFIIHNGHKSNLNYTLKRIDIQYRLLDFFSFQLYISYYDKNIKLIFNEDKKKLQIISNPNQTFDIGQVERILRITNAIPIVLTYVLKSAKFYPSTKTTNDIKTRSNEMNVINVENRLLENMAKARLSVDLQKSNDSAGLLAGGQAFRCLISPKEFNSPEIIEHLSTSSKLEFRKSMQYDKYSDQPRTSSKLDDLLSVSNTDYSSLETIDASSSRSNHFSPLIVRYFKAFNEPFKENKKKSIYADQYNIPQNINNNKPGISSSTSLSQLFASVGGLISQSPANYPPPQNQFSQGDVKSPDNLASSRNDVTNQSIPYDTSKGPLLTSNLSDMNKPGYPFNNNNTINSSASSNNKTMKMYDAPNQSKQPAKSQDPYAHTSFSNQSGPIQNANNIGSLNNSNNNPPGSMLISLLNEDTPKNFSQVETFSESSNNSNKTKSPLEMEHSLQNLGANPHEDENYNRYPNQQGHIYPDNQNFADPKMHQANSGQRKLKRTSSPSPTPTSNISPNNSLGQLTTSMELQCSNLNNNGSNSIVGSNASTLGASLLNPMMMNSTGPNMNSNKRNNNPFNNNSNSNTNSSTNHINMSQSSSSSSSSTSNLHNTSNNNLNKSSSSVYDFEDPPAHGIASNNMPTSENDFSISNKVLTQNKPPFKEDISNQTNSGSAVTPQTSLKLKIKGMTNSQLAVNSSQLSPSQLDSRVSGPPVSCGNIADKFSNRPQQPPPKTVVSGKPAAEVMRKIQEPSFTNEQNKSGIVRKNKISDSGEQPKPKKKQKVMHPSGLTVSQIRAAEGRKPLGRPPGSKNSNSTTKGSKSSGKISDPMSQMNMNFMSNPAMHLNNPMNGPNNNNIQANNQFSNNGPNMALGNNSNPSGLMGSGGMSLFNLSSSGNGYKIPKLKNSSKPLTKSNSMTTNDPEVSSVPDFNNMGPTLTGSQSMMNLSSAGNSQKKTKKGIDDIMSQLRTNQSAYSHLSNTTNKMAPLDGTIPGQKTNSGYPSMNVPLQQPRPHEHTSSKMNTYPPQQNQNNEHTVNQNSIQQAKPKSHKVDTDTPASPTPESPPGLGSRNFPINNQPANSINIPTYRNSPGSNQTTFPMTKPMKPHNNNLAKINNIRGNDGHQKMNNFQQKQQPNSSNVSSYSSYQQPG